MKNTDDLGKTFEKFCHTVSRLRDKEAGCPWDLEQTHSSLKKYLIEEAYEAIAEMQDNATASLCDELGDVLLQVVLHAQIASEDKRFDISNVINAINKKMIRRHPHVFEPKYNKDNSIEKISENWQKIKESENSKNSSKSIGKLNQFRKIFPATMQAQKIGSFTKNIKFDWQNAKECFDHFFSEVMELKEALENNNFKSNQEVRLEASDVYFTLAQLCRHLNESAELVASMGNEKFLSRFEKLEEILHSRQISFEKAEKTDLESAWNQAKK